MKKVISLVLFILLIMPLGCSSNDGKKTNPTQTTSKEEIIEKDYIRLSSVSDVTDTNNIRTYDFYAPYTDTFILEKASDSICNITLLQNEVVVGEDDKKITIDATKNEKYQLCIETYNPNEEFELKVKAVKNEIVYPYDVLGAEDITTINVETNSDAEITYQKREGGTYIYSNNPELIPDDSIGTAFIQNKDLTGEVFFTFEHANYSKSKFYLGYQLKNEGDKDVYVTVTNIGYQVGGTWFGQRAWYDFYNTSFKLPDDYLVNGTIASKYAGYDYAYSDYKPRIFQPITYRIPAGEMFYVIGGTTKDAYRNINVDNTANKLVNVGNCTNGNVKFNVTGGAVTATFYCYSNPEQVAFEPELTGYRLKGYSRQYGGSANHHGVIDSYITWAFDDTNTSGVLPVTYKTAFDPKAPTAKKAYAEYNNQEVTYTGRNAWMSHLNPQNDHYAIGSDIVEFSCIDEKGKSVLIDNNHADGIGLPANTANWMIEYQENYTLINRSSENKTVTLYKKDYGTLAILIRDSVTGELIDTYYTIGQAKTGHSFQYPIEVAANSTAQITICYVLVACSYGNVTHWALVD